MSTTKMIFTWLLRLVAAGLMIQTLFFKFTAAPESVYIFSTLGMEPWGRIGTGVIELIASLLILLPATTWIGAVIGAGTMCGAILSHLGKLGIEVQGDGGQLFSYAIITFVSCVLLIWIEREKIVRLYRLAFSR